MKAKAYQISALSQQIQKSFKGALIFGPDFSVVQDVALQISKLIVPNLKDPFNVVKITPPQLKENPSLLQDEGNSLSLMGGRRLVWLREADNSCSDSVELFLDHIQTDSFLLITADNLQKTSSLRLLGENHPHLLTIACYSDQPRDIQEQIQNILKSNQYTISVNALSLLTDRLNENRLNTYSEIEKLMIYVGKTRQITEKDILAIIPDMSSTSMDMLCHTIATGKHQQADKACQLLLASGETPIGILRILTIYFNKLLVGVDTLSKGFPIEKALKIILRPAQFTLEETTKQQLSFWKKENLIRVINLLIQTEKQSKTTGFPQDLMLERTITLITNVAQKQKSSVYK